MSNGQKWQELTLWPEVIPANPSVTPEGERGPTTLDTSGPCSPSAFAWYDPATRYWRTCQATLVSGSDEFSETWPRSGMTRNGTVFQRRPSAPRTSATAYSSSLHGELQWTPTATANQDSPSMEARAPGRHLWPTPESCDNRDRGGPTTPSVQRRRQNGRQITLSMTVTGQLSPKWVEWLMGFPIGWTDLEPSETQSCHK